MQIERIVEVKITVERSRFFAVAFPAETLAVAKRFVASRRRRLRKACHHCWSFRQAPDGACDIEQARDDGEVGRPGMVLLEALRSHDLEGGLVVSRIFGGVKLGPGGVARAFRQAARGALAEL